MGRSLNWEVLEAVEVGAVVVCGSGSGSSSSIYIGESSVVSAIAEVEVGLLAAGVESIEGTPMNLEGGRTGRDINDGTWADVVLSLAFFGSVNKGRGLFICWFDNNGGIGVKGGLA